MTALGRHVAATLQLAFDLLPELEKLAPAEHAALMQRCCEHLHIAAVKRGMRPVRKELPR